MALSGIKSNKCFENVPGLKIKEQYTQVVTAGTVAPTPKNVYINDDRISVDDVVIVTPLALSGNPPFNGVEIEACVMNGTAIVSIINPTENDVTVSFNVVVL